MAEMRHVIELNKITRRKSLSFHFKTGCLFQIEKNLFKRYIIMKQMIMQYTV